MSDIKNTVYGPTFRSKLDLMGIRFADEGGDGDGAGDAAPADKSGDDSLGDAGKQAIDRMKDTVKATKGELKAYSDLGLTPAEIKALVDEKNAGKPVDEEAIVKRVRQQVEAETKEKSATKFRASAIREQAASLGFIDPKDALRSLDEKDLAGIDVDDDGDVDGDDVKKLLEKLAEKKPYLLKPTDNTPGHRDAGIGSTGSGTKPDVQPGAARLRNAYANTPKK